MRINTSEGIRRLVRIVQIVLAVWAFLFFASTRWPGPEGHVVAVMATPDGTGVRFPDSLREQLGCSISGATDFEITINPRYAVYDDRKSIRLLLPYSIHENFNSVRICVPYNELPDVVIDPAKIYGHPFESLEVTDNIRDNLQHAAIALNIHLNNDKNYENMFIANGKRQMRYTKAANYLLPLIFAVIILLLTEFLYLVARWILRGFFPVRAAETGAQ